MLGYEFWQRRFGGAPDVVGKEIRIEGHPLTIIGVTRKWFTGVTTGDPPEITVPVTAEPLIRGGDVPLDSRSLLWISVTGRLKDGVTIAQARAQLQSFWPEVLLATVSTETPGLRRQTFLSMGLDVTSAAKGVAADLRSQFTRPLYVLMGIVGLILLVACANLANLMLARAAARSHEMSVRLALGANRWTLARQVLTESLALSFTGALLGLILAYWGGHFLVAFMTQDNYTPVALDLRPDFRVLSLTAAVSILTGILFGLAPAWRSSSEDPASALQHNARNLSGGVGRLSKTLIVTQVALSLILLLGASLFVRSFQQLRSIDTGFDKENVLEITLSSKPGGYHNLDMMAYRRHLIERVSSIQGVRSVSFSDNSIPNQGNWRDSVSGASADSRTSVNLMTNGVGVSPEFFATLGIRLLRGRDFAWTDEEHHPHLAIVSDSLAKGLFTNSDAIGQHIRFGIMPGFQDLEIVGIAANARISGLRDASTPTIYLPSFNIRITRNWATFSCALAGLPKRLERLSATRSTRSGTSTPSAPKRFRR